MPASAHKRDQPLLYAPTLHRELAPALVPADVLFMHPGLPGAGNDSRAAAPAKGFFRPANYPFSPAQARAALAELLSIGEALGLADDPGLWGAANATFSPLSRHLSATEKAALNRFAAAGQDPEQAQRAAASETNAPSGLIAAHKALLLAWDLEERLLELAELREKITATSKTLAANLADIAEDQHSFVADSTDRADPLDPTDPVAEAALFIPPESDIQTAEWRLCLSAMTAFLPPDALVVTAHPDMRQSMHAAGMLQPLPEDTAALTENWPPALRAATLWACLPLWRVMGYTRPPENKPWLLHAPEILVCPEHCRPEHCREVQS